MGSIFYESTVTNHPQIQWLKLTAKCVARALWVSTLGWPQLAGCLLHLWGAEGQLGIPAPGSWFAVT